jgi:hypothetical protein
MGGYPLEENNAIVAMVLFRTSNNSCLQLKRSTKVNNTYIDNRILPLSASDTYIDSTRSVFMNFSLVDKPLETIFAPTNLISVKNLLNDENNNWTNCASSGGTCFCSGKVRRGVTPN